VSNQSGVQYLELTSPQLVNALEKCNSGDDISGASFASIDKKKGTFPSSPDVLKGDGQLMKQFDGFYIEAGYPNGIGCADTSKSDDFFSVFNDSKDALRDAFQTATVVQ
jgi:hypothetical protein